MRKYFILIGVMVFALTAFAGGELEKKIGKPKTQVFDSTSTHYLIFESLQSFGGYEKYLFWVDSLAWVDSLEYVGADTFTIQVGEHFGPSLADSSAHFSTSGFWTYALDCYGSVRLSINAIPLTKATAVEEAGGDDQWKPFYDIQVTLPAGPQPYTIFKITMTSIAADCVRVNMFNLSR